ncbi:Kelch repeat-containing protein [Chondromyces apiculatus]|uniref:Kelch domain protein n=1 Tax=Chondromyces apiculatus DSM 436 TaxID=1192034 RepID=A0A017SUI0_9BACT|nr:kelch repeat-containing protein [Chondromyces apiculatus]EYF00270.1 Hypothetical protein CAP_0999 [Chondromyces apiculatus DSM 436]
MRFPDFLMRLLPACAGLLVSLPAAAQSWVQSSLNVPRLNQSAALLPGGDVLLVGGDFDYGTGKAVERYSAATGTWSIVGDTLQDHVSSTHAFSLPGGQVLVGSMEAPFEIYDPVSETSISLSPAGQFFSDTATTRLSDGDLLFVGGGMSTFDWGDTQRFDVATNTLQVVAFLSTPRRSHTATLLVDGRVLVVGGLHSLSEVGPTEVLASVEIYDPVADTWSAGAPLPGARVNHRASRLPDGRVLVTGGQDATLALLDSTVLYDPATDTWSAGPTLPSARAYHEVVSLPSGRVVLVGGDGALTSALAYDPATHAFVALPSLSGERIFHDVTYIPGEGVLVTGGDSEIAELYPLGATGEGEACVITDECASGTCEEGLCTDDSGPVGAGGAGPGATSTSVSTGVGAGGAGGGGPGGPGGGCSLDFLDFSGSPGGAAMLLMAPGLFAFRRRRSVSGGRAKR